MTQENLLVGRIVEWEEKGQRFQGIVQSYFVESGRMYLVILDEDEGLIYEVMAIFVKVVD